MFPLIPTILEKGEIVEIRPDNSMQISYRFTNKQTLSCIVYKQKTTEKYTLISCFRDFI